MNGKVATTSVAHKIIVGLSGLLLCGFLVAHLAGNFLIYLPADGYKAYNDYAHGLHSLSVLPVVEIGLLAVFLGHVVYAFVTWSRNRGARPQKYAVQRSKRGATGVSAQNVMQWSGIVVLAFILLHLVDMRFGLRFPERPGVTPAERALAVLHDPLSASVYFVGSLLLGYHLFHGFQSAFQSLGFASERMLPKLRVVGILFAALVAVGFASFPFWANVILK